MGSCVRSLLCFAVLCFFSSLTFVPPGKRELIAILYLSSECLNVMSLSLPLPNGAVGWSVVCDCDLFWLYSIIWASSRENLS